VNVETKNQSKQWMHTNSSNKFKQTLPARKPLATVFWDRKGALMVEFMHTRDKNTVRNVWRNNKKKKNCVGPFRTKGVEC
jgi:hypothetical protein